MYVEMRRGEKDMEYERASTSIIQNTINLQAMKKRIFPATVCSTNIPVYM
jgi:hypothetical protein